MKLKTSSLVGALSFSGIHQTINYLLEYNKYNQCVDKIIHSPSPPQFSIEEVARDYCSRNVVSINELPLNTLINFVNEIPLTFILLYASLKFANHFRKENILDKIIEKY